MKISDQKIYLASKSPRRRELLRQIDINFELLLLREKAPRGPDVTELVLPGEPALTYVQRVTREKAAFAHEIMRTRRLPIHPILTADTTVALDGQILGKPADVIEAQGMLKILAGRTHQVMTSLALQQGDDVLQMTQISEVTFTTLSEQEIIAYCLTPEPYDKAGAYGIQGSAARFIAHIAGSYTGIMGLPLFETAQLLKQAAIRIL